MAAVNNAYEIWRSGRNDSETLGKLNRLVDGVKFPFSEATTSEDMGKRIRRSVMNFDYSARSLFQFSESIYPSDHPVTTNGWIDEERRDLSKRFDELGRQLYNQDGIVFDEVRNMILNQSRLIKVLTFLEFAQCAQRDTPGPGKYGLFYLCSKLAD